MTLTRSSAPALKNAMASSSTAAGEYTLIYWGGVTGRGEFVRLAFECAGKEYKQINEPKAIVSHFSNLKTTGYPPALAPPILKLPGGQYISQTSNILVSRSLWDDIIFIPSFLLELLGSQTGS